MTVKEKGNDSDVVILPSRRPREHVLLTPDDRYDIWLVKAAERPELLCLSEEQSLDDDNEKALQDGCDIPGWRCERVVKIDEDDDDGCPTTTSATLNVGPGCTLLRRESQLPIVLPRTKRCREPWELLKKDCMDETTTTTEKKIPRLSCSEVQGRHPWFERQNIPVLLFGCTNDWKAMQSCTFEKLVERFGDLQWRFSDTHSETMSLSTYKTYIYSLEGLTDDAPLAVYDSQFGCYDDARASILQEYTVPSCFNTDLFADLIQNDDDRPPFRWILIGPERSGTGLHVDPVGTHAWVTLIQGCKRWVLFPAGTPPGSIGMQEPQIPSVIWFRDFYQTIMNNHPNAIEVVQYPGETVYVPAGWPHLVLNLELSVAITHNYATEYPSMDRLWHAVVQAEPALAERFHSALQVQRPDLAKQISAAAAAQTIMRQQCAENTTTPPLLTDDDDDEKTSEHAEDE